MPDENQPTPQAAEPIDTDSNLLDLPANPDNYQLDNNFQDIEFDKDSLILEEPSNPSAPITPSTPANTESDNIIDFLREKDNEKTEPETVDDDNPNETEFTEAELASISKKLGHIVTSTEDVRKLLKTETQTSEAEIENATLSELQNKSSLFDRFIKMDDKTLVKEKLLNDARQKGKDINNQEVIDEIDAKIQGFEDLEELESMASALRGSIKAAKTDADNGIQKINQARDARTAANAKKNTEDLENAFADIFSGKKFMGVDLTKEAVLDAFKYVKSGQFFNDVNNDQGIIARLALALKLDPEIRKRAERPSQSDKNRNAFDTLTKQHEEHQQRRIHTAKSTAANGGDMENVLKFIQ